MSEWPWVAGSLRLAFGKTFSDTVTCDRTLNWSVCLSDARRKRPAGDDGWISGSWSCVRAYEYVESVLSPCYGSAYICLGVGYGQTCLLHARPSDFETSFKLVGHDRTRAETLDVEHNFEYSYQSCFCTSSVARFGIIISSSMIRESHHRAFIRLSRHCNQSGRTSPRNEDDASASASGPTALDPTLSLMKRQSTINSWLSRVSGYYCTHVRPLSWIDPEYICTYTIYGSRVRKCRGSFLHETQLYFPEVTVSRALIMTDKCNRERMNRSLKISLDTVPGPPSMSSNAVLTPVV